jgi:hypothetical protein
LLLTALAAFFSTFNLTIDFFPYYAAAVIIELWTEDGTNKPYVRLFYQTDESLARAGQLWAEITNNVSGCNQTGKCYRDVCCVVYLFFIYFFFIFFFIFFSG